MKTFGKVKKTSSVSVQKEHRVRLLPGTLKGTHRGQHDTAGRGEATEAVRKSLGKMCLRKRTNARKSKNAKRRRGKVHTQEV